MMVGKKSGSVGWAGPIHVAGRRRRAESWPHSLELGVVDVRLGKGFEVRHCCAWGLLLLAPTVTGLRVRP